MISYVENQACNNFHICEPMGRTIYVCCYRPFLAYRIGGGFMFRNVYANAIPNDDESIFDHNLELNINKLRLKICLII